MFKGSKKKEIIPFPFPVYFCQLVLLVLAGLADSVYLTKIHYQNYSDIGYQSFCAISRTVNCDTVSQSIYSVFLNLPVAVWGIAGYVFFLLLLFFAWSKSAEKRRCWAILYITAIVFVCCSIILAIISIFYINSYCIMCIISYCVNFLLLYYVWLIRRRFNKSGVISGFKRDMVYLWESRTAFLSAIIIFFVSFGTLYFFYPAYWKLEVPPWTSEMSMGISEEGHPWIGAEEPELVITEFTDYQCFQCRKMHYFLRFLVAEHSDTIRLVHCHFPMDHEYNPLVKEPFHIGSGKMALIAICATANDKFWQMNDLLFELAGREKDVEIKEIALRTGLNPKQLVSAMRNKVRSNVKNSFPFIHNYIEILYNKDKSFV